jgi:dTDP-4-amino-4,6-dideoxygalactose transaminase
VPRVPDHIEHAAYKAYVFVERDALPAGWTRDDVVTALVEEGIPTYQGSCSEVYLERAFDEIGCRPAAPLPVARELGENSLMFLVHPTLEKRHIDATCTAIETLARQIEDGALKPAVGCE